MNTLNTTNVLHIGLTGHRPNKLGGYDISTPSYQKLQNDLEQYIHYQLQSHDTVVGHSGLALGADTVWSKAIMNMREKHSDRVKFHAEIPFMSQHSKWFKKSDIDFWHKQVDTADDSTVYGDFTTEITNAQAGKALNDRNIGMIDHSDVMLAIWDGSSSGTGNAVKYSLSMNKPIQFIDPKKYFR